jgi:hypothetical protein
MNIKLDEHETNKGEKAKIKLCKYWYYEKGNMIESQQVSRQSS